MPLYLYAVTDADHPLPVDGATGIGASPAPLRAVRAARVAAVVSEAPAQLRAKRRDLMAHQKVLLMLGAAGAVLPLRFGTLAPDDDAVRCALADQESLFTERLRDVGDRVEFNVKALQDEDTALRDVLRDSAEARRLSALTRDGAGSHDDQLALGTVVAAGVEALQARHAQDIARRLEPLAYRTAGGDPTGEVFLNLSLLIERGQADAFAASVGRIAESLGHGLELRVTGPLPPYSFV
ncbi:GvpL/GvpF family gas vesicle protein [Streptomyces sp. ADMS]|uniref:GvpL/GvpF family gas vesicle protein n=1 Tax=Streptomyces sp. ADMS TaxID=3071415 RepID=UPI00296E7894|nr:GvpL/GvpF family gas vesicle protein [Streptomyces sp. ADMS]MDW4903867.1 GvpL/GvpF family gas vesicle protein [Streptomyces sp. ADMS]